MSIFQDLGQIESFKCLTTNKTTSLKSGIQEVEYNYNMSCGNIDGIDIDKVIQFFKGTPFVWIINEKSFLLKEKLKERGFKLNFVTTGFLKTLNKSNDEFPLGGSHNIEVCKIEKAEELESWAKSCASVYKYNPKNLYKFLLPILMTPRISSFYVGKYKDEAISTCLVLKHNTDAVLLFVTTKAPFRKKGIAKQVLLQAMNNAFQQGIKKVFLDTYVWGVPLFQKLEFTEVCQFNIFSYKNIQSNENQI